LAVTPTFVSSTQLTNQFSDANDADTGPLLSPTLAGKFRAHGASPSRDLPLLYTVLQGRRVQ
jgi:hypothetical protein